MKYAAIILAMVFVACAAVTVIVATTSNVTIGLSGIHPTTAVAADDDPQRFLEIAGTAGSGIDAENIHDYRFITWHLAVRNDSYVTMDMVEATVQKNAGDGPRLDAAGTGQRDGLTIAPHSDGELTVEMLIRGNPGHRITVSWYIWGRKYTQEIVV